jgi:hypothetical protein
MEFLSVRDLRTSPKEVWGTLAREGEVVITNNGKPTAIMIDVDGATLEEKLAAIRQAEAMRLFNGMRAKAAENGFMTDARIEAEIAAARAEAKQKAR